MDFSSVRRALESLERRQPPLSDDCLAVVNRVRVGLLEGDTARSEEDLLASLQELLTTEYVTTSSNNNEEELPKIRWEPLAVALLVSTELLQQQNSSSSSEEAATEAAAAVYMDGPRVPVMVESTANDNVVPRLSNVAVAQLCPTLHQVCLQHLEHAEPRVRTLVAQAVGAYCRCSSTADYAREMHARFVTCYRSDNHHGRHDREAHAGRASAATPWHF